MLAFYRARLGGFDPLVWQSPIDARTYQVRFDSTIRAVNFTPGLFRSGAQLAFLTRHTPTLTSVVGTTSNFGAFSDATGELSPGSGGTIPSSDQTSGTGVSPAAFLFPGAWYWAGIDYQSGFSTENILTTNRLYAAPFAVAQSGYVLDALAVGVNSPLSTQAVYLGLYASRGDSGSVFDAYPATRIVSTSAAIATGSSMITGTISVAPLADGIYWLALVTSYTGTGARFRTWGLLSGLITGVSKALILDGFLQRRLIRQSKARWAIHALIFLPFVFRFFWGLVGLLASLCCPDRSGTWLLLDKNHPATAFLFDLTGVMAVLGIVFAVVRKMRRSSEEILERLPRPDRTANGLLAAIVLVGFLLECMRIAMTGSPPGAEFASVGYGLSRLFSGVELTGLYGYVWYGHAVLTGLFVAYLPFSRMVHMITVPIALALNAGSGHKY